MSQTRHFRISAIAVSYLSVLVSAFLIACAGCSSSGNSGVANRNATTPGGRVANAPDHTGQNESGSVGAAEVIFEQTSPPMDIVRLSALVQERVPYPCTRAEWVGFTTTIPQLRIGTPTPMFLQIEDDPSWVPAEIREMAETADQEFGRATANKIAACRVRISILGPAIKSPSTGKDSISVVGGSSLDPAIPEIDATLRIIADIVGGYVHDSVNGKWRYASKKSV